jgi:Spy/CpxP family protein refolding chaperone
MKLPLAFLAIVMAGTLAAQQNTQPGTNQSQQPGSNQNYSSQQPASNQNYSGQQHGTGQSYAGQPGTNEYSNQKFSGRAEGTNRSDYISEHLAKELNLTRDQQMKVREIFADTRHRAEALQPKMREERDALKNAVKTGNDREIDRILQQNSQLNTDFEAMHVKAMAKVYTLLTPEQKKLFDQLDSGWFGPSHHVARTATRSSSRHRS